MFNCSESFCSILSQPPRGQKRVKQEGAAASRPQTSNKSFKTFSGVEALRTRKELPGTLSAQIMFLNLKSRTTSRCCCTSSHSSVLQQTRSLHVHRSFLCRRDDDGLQCFLTRGGLACVTVGAFRAALSGRLSSFLGEEFQHVPYYYQSISFSAFFFPLERPHASLALKSALLFAL